MMDPYIYGKINIVTMPERSRASSARPSDNRCGNYGIMIL